MSPESFTPVALPKLGRAAADEQVEQELRRGYAAGYAKGQRDAHLEAEAAAEEAEQARQAAHEAFASEATYAIDTVHRAARAFADRAADLAALDEERVLTFAVDLAEHILRVELSDEVRAAAVARRRAEAAVEGVGDATVQLSEQDARVLGDQPGFPYTVNPALNPGDVLVSYPHGQVDLRVKEGLDRVRDALNGVLR